MTEVTITELDRAHTAGEMLVDVREPDEYAAGHVPGAQLLPLAIVPVRMHELPKDRPVYVICRSGGRSFQAALAMRQAGIDARPVAGGTDAWVDAGRPLARGTAA